MRAARTLLGPALLLGVCAFASHSTGSVASAPPASQRETGRDILDVNGHPLKLFAPAGAADVIFFIATDCPISNSYAPEIQSLCRDYAARGVGCALIYEDVPLSSSSAALNDAVRRHLREYQYREIPAAVDASRTVAKRVKASVTPQAVVIDRTGKLRYRGRIDNLYASLGKTRRNVTERDLRAALDAVLSGKAVPKAETEALGCYIVDPALLRK